MTEDDPNELMLCRVTARVLSFNGCPPGKEVILSRAAAYEQARRGRVFILGPLVPNPTDEEE